MPFSENQGSIIELSAEERKKLVVNGSKELIGEALKSTEAIEELKSWRALDEFGSTAKKVRRFFENRAAEKRAGLSVGDLPVPNDRSEELLSLVVNKDFVVKPEVKKIFSNLSSVASAEVMVNVWELLSSDKVSFQTKTEWFKSHLLPALRFLQNRDLADARGEAKKTVESPPSESDSLPPSSSDSLDPSMDEMEKNKEGENRGWFTVSPFYGGYYRGSDYESWDAVNLRWLKGPRRFSKIENILASDSEGVRRVMVGMARSGYTDLPVPYGFKPDIKTLTPSDVTLSISFDDCGGYSLTNRESTAVRFSVELVSTNRSLGSEGAEAGFGDFILSTETENFLARTKSSGASLTDMARAVKQFVRKNLKYSNESAMNAVYRSGNPQEYFLRMEQNKKADCDVANTYFIALLSKLGIKARLVSGHYVKTKNRVGSAVLSSGTAHAWSEVWVENDWLRLDATPPGDPDMDDEETDEKPDNEVNEGDFGEQEAEEISDEKLAEMIEKAKKDLAKKAMTENKEDKAAGFAKEAGCSVEEARQVLSQIEAARGLVNKDGRLIRECLAQEFQKIIQENLVERLRYIAPVRMSEADDLDDPVEAWIDLKTGVADPSGFAKYRQEIKCEQSYGGFDVIFVVDKSGSMSEIDLQSGTAKWQGQQKFVFLFLDALFAAAEEMRRVKIKIIGSLDIRVGLVSFAGSGAVSEIPFSENWSAKERLVVWRSLQQNIGGGTPDHLGLQAAGEIFASADKTARQMDKNRLRLVLVSADGDSDNKSETMAAKEALKQKGIIVKAAGIGAGAKAVKATYFPDGVNLPSFSEEADWAASQVISEAQKLYPKKVKK